MHSVLLLLSLALTPVQDPTRDQILDQDVAAAIERLVSERATESQAAKEELVLLGRRAVPALVKALTKTDEPRPAVRLRRLICEVLGQIRPASDDAFQALVSRLSDREEYGTTVAAAAAWALGRVGDDRAIAPLISSLKAKETEVDKDLKHACILALGVLRAREAVPALLPALKDTKITGDGEWGYSIAAAAADALGRIRAREGVDALAEVLDKTGERDPVSGLSIADHAARALERITGEKKGDLYGDTKAMQEALANWQNWNKINLTKKRLSALMAAVEGYRKDKTKLPATLADLASTGFKGELTDGWGQEFKFAAPGSGADFDLYSLGADQKAGGKDANGDLWNHEAWKGAKAEGSRKKIAEIDAALRRFQTEQGRWPEALQDLVVKPVYELKAAWPEAGYWKEKTLPNDDFGHAFLYRTPGTAGEPFDLLSLGLDGVEGGEEVDADLWNHDKRPAAEEKK